MNPRLSPQSLPQDIDLRSRFSALSFERGCEAISGEKRKIARNCLTSTFKYIVMQMRKGNCEKGYWYIFLFFFIFSVRYKKSCIMAMKKKSLEATKIIIYYQFLKMISSGKKVNIKSRCIIIYISSHNFQFDNSLW